MGDWYPSGTGSLTPPKAGLRSSYGDPGKESARLCADAATGLPAPGEERRVGHDRVQVAAPFRLGGTWQSQLPEKKRSVFATIPANGPAGRQLLHQARGGAALRCHARRRDNCPSHGYGADNCELCGLASCAEGVEIAADSTGDTCPGMGCAHPSSRFECGAEELHGSSIGQSGTAKIAQKAIAVGRVADWERPQ
jgi:hypothetical protein